MMRDAPTPEHLSTALCDWLGNRFECDVATSGQPARISGGFDCWTYSLRFAGDGLPAEWRQSLVARVPPTPERFLPLSRESQLQTWAADHGYPAPRVVHVLPSGELLNLPVQLMSWAPGATMATTMVSRPWRAPRLVTQLGELHAALHSLAVPDWAPAGEWSVLERRLGLVRFVLSRLAHPELEAALYEVEQLRPRLEDAEPVLCHGDFHPVNLLVAKDHIAVIDWTDTGIGDAHSDIARTSWLFRFASALAHDRLERSILKPVAPLLARGYLRSYRRQRFIDPGRVRLWTPPHLLHAWAMFVADEHQLTGPSRAGSDFRPSMSSWARHQFSLAMQAIRSE